MSETAPAAPVKTCYKIVLEGHGDMVVSLVDEATWGWINRDDSAERAAGESAWDELDLAPKQLADAIRAFAGRGIHVPEILVTVGSAENDRCLALTDGGCLFHDNGGDDINAADEWASANGYTIVETFDGYIY